MKKLVRRLLEEFFQKTGIKGDIDQWTQTATPIVFLVFAAVALYFAFSYYRAYKNWNEDNEDAGEAPRVMLLSVATLGISGLGLAGYAISLWL